MTEGGEDYSSENDLDSGRLALKQFWFFIFDGVTLRTRKLVKSI